MEDVDDIQNDAENDDDAQDDDDEDDNEDDEQDESQVQPAETNNSTQEAQPSETRHSSISPHGKIHITIRPEALNASTYDIVPTMAAPQATSINALAATPDMRYWFTGGTDGYVRKYDGAATINGKTLLTVAQRHPFVDTVTKAGVLMSYWENDEPVQKQGDEPTISPVYSLAVQSEAIWLLSGLESGGINLQSVRHDEGKRIHCLQKHTSAVSVLTLAADEKSVLSGSWDKSIYDWDLNTGAVKRGFEGSGGQISAIEVRPASSFPVPEESGELEAHGNGNGTFASNNADKPAPQSNGLTNGVANGMVNGDNGNAMTNGTNGPSDGMTDAQGSPRDSLFGDTDSLFGDGDGGSAPSGGNFGADEDDEFSRAIGGIDHSELDAPADSTMDDAPLTLPIDPAPSAPPALPQELPSSPVPERPIANGLLPHAKGMETESSAPPPAEQDAAATTDTTFLAASIDGTLRVWDRRQSAPVAIIPNRPGVPPWCMSACWSPDGNFIYAGRRNGTVEEFSLHKGLRGPERTFRFPTGSGAVSAVRAMGNGRHLIWYAFLSLVPHPHTSHILLILSFLVPPMIFCDCGT